MHWWTWSYNEVRRGKDAVYIDRDKVITQEKVQQLR